MTPDMHILDFAALELNAASDRLSGAIENLDASLKAYNYGLEVWTAADNGVLRAGYAKIGGKWGLAISGTVDGAAEEWKFNQAPRALRIAAVQLLPALLGELAQSAAEKARQAREATELVDALVAEMQQRRN